MPLEFSTRAPRGADIPALAAIADATLFSGHLLADMIAPALQATTDDVWRVVEKDHTPVGFALAKSEQMADRSWILRLICRAPKLHGQGAGTVLFAAMEAALPNPRLFVIDTTQSEKQARAQVLRGARLPAGRDDPRFLRRWREYGELCQKVGLARDAKRPPRSDQGGRNG
ncbi:MAG: GNAT family N-acetyltransferase [Pseudomonadota bacterium]